jgi:hypothetical protein
MDTEQPPEPTDVRAEMEDGTIIPLELYYWGEAGGLHRWDTVHELAERPKVIHVGMLPPRTVVHPRIRRADTTGADNG